LKRPFTVDGCNFKTAKTVYLFQGCYWHGCQEVSSWEYIPNMNKTMEQVNLLRTWMDIM
jgi:hypothetical protein